MNQQKDDADRTLSAPKASQASPYSSKVDPIPVTPAHGKDTASFRPTTPFQLGSHPPADSESPRTPTPAPRASKGSGKSVRSIFSSSKLASRSPERATPSSDIVVAPSTPTAGASGSQGLLFRKGKKNEKGMKNVLNSRRLSPVRGSGSGSAASGDLEDYADELADGRGGGGVDVHRGGRRAGETSGVARSGFDGWARGGRKVARAVMVPRVRSREEEDGGRTEEPKKKKPRRSTRAVGGSADRSDAAAFSKR